MMDPFGHDKYFSIFEVAEQQCVDVGVVRDWIKEGLHHNMLPGYTQISSTDLREFLDSRRKADVSASHRLRLTPSAETHNGKPAKPRWHAHGRLTPAQCAEWQGVDRETVEQWIASGLRCETVGSTRLIWRADCKTFLKAHGTKSPDTTGEVGIESTGAESIIVAEEFHHGFFG